jgi:3-deoxy-D-manno-octulosonate 8-phosphate phosphatase KdsC-like HAD superfamily phosphatase
MEDFTKKELEVVVDYLASLAVDMEYTSVANENKATIELVNSIVSDIENYLYLGDD